MKELARNLRPNNQASANALGGNYKAPLVGDSVFGSMLYDEDLQTTLFSQSLLTDMSCVAANDNGRERVARFPDVKFAQIPSLEAIPPSQLFKLPVLFCYRNGTLKQSLMGPDAFSAAPTATDLTEALGKLGILKPTSCSEEDSDDDV